MLSDFIDTLSAEDRRFLEEHLVSLNHEPTDANDREHSGASLWQHRHRIMARLKAFLTGQ